MNDSRALRLMRFEVRQGNVGVLGGWAAVQTHDLRAEVIEVRRDTDNQATLLVVAEPETLASAMQTAS